MTQVNYEETFTGTVDGAMRAPRARAPPVAFASTRIRLSRRQLFRVLQRNILVPYPPRRGLNGETQHPENKDPHDKL